jgi:hypothetical protein
VVVLEPALVDVRVRVGHAVMGVLVLMLDVLVLVGRVRVGMRNSIVLVLMCVRMFMGVVFGHTCPRLCSSIE